MEKKGFIKNLKYNENGLIPVIIQDYLTGQILMLAYMNRESIALTLKDKTTWFWSRSRKELWNKGASSGNKQFIKEIFLDCDEDAILIKVEQKGNACHTGNKTCFYRKVYPH